MNKKQRVHLIIDLLNKYVPHPKPPLSFKNPFKLLIAVMLSAHSTDKIVNRVAPKLFCVASTPQEMACLSPNQIQGYIHSCGLSKRKSQAIFDLSNMLIKRYHGKVPPSLKALETLPGVGHKTASVVMAFAFKSATFPVDTHIFRCAKRWKLSQGKTREKVERDLKKIFPKKLWKKLHLQIILFARKYCPARGHVIEQCPICSVLEQPRETDQKTL